MIDLKHEMERELSLIDPPDLWDRIEADASNSGDAAVVDLTAARQRLRRPTTATGAVHEPRRAREPGQGH